jgi:RsiW-degrading membrane proteinase PrsW (M82 family)
MNPILVSILAILPPIIIAALAYFFLDKENKEPLFPTLICFLLGVLIAFPAYFLQEYFWEKEWFTSDSFWAVLGYSFLVVALFEELVKIILLILFPSRSKHTDEPIDLLLYAILIAMGFASLENLLYGLQHGFDVIVVRALTAVPAHAIFGTIMGYYFVRHKFLNIKYSLVFAFVIPFLIHGLYDFFLIQDFSENLMLASIVVLIGSGYFVWSIIKQVKKIKVNT